MDYEEASEAVWRQRVEELERDKEASAEALVAQYEISTKAEAEVARLRGAQHQAVIGWDAEREKSERLRGLLAEWIPRHSAACCTPTPELGSFPPGPFLPKWCKCDSLSKRSRAALAPEVKP